MRAECRGAGEGRSANGQWRWGGAAGARFVRGPGLRTDTAGPSQQDRNFTTSVRNRALTRSAPAIKYTREMIYSVSVAADLPIHQYISDKFRDNLNEAGDLKETSTQCKQAKHRDIKKHALLTLLG